MDKQKYIMIGTKTITKELFRNVLRPLDNQTFKPNGGLWASEYRPYTISPWLEYLVNNQEYYSHKDIHSATIFELKNNTNILKIDNIDKLNEIQRDYPSYHHLLNYYYGNESSINFELISKDYDAIYLDYTKLYTYSSKRIFRGWNVNTLLLFNLNVIDNCKSIEINFYSPKTLEYPYFEKKEDYSIEEESIYHKKLSIFTQELFNELISQRSMFHDYDDYFSYLIECTKKCIQIAMLNKENETNKIRKLLKEKSIEVTNYIIIRNICANTLSNYLKDNVKIEKELPKTKIREIREYKIEENKN